VMAKGSSKETRKHKGRGSTHQWARHKVKIPGYAGGHHGGSEIIRGESKNDVQCSGNYR
jgi:hypothetical protein